MELDRPRARVGGFNENQVGDAVFVVVGHQPRAIGLRNDWGHGADDIEWLTRVDNNVVSVTVDRPSRLRGNVPARCAVCVGSADHFQSADDSPTVQVFVVVAKIRGEA